MADWKDRLGVLYSTNPDFEYTTEQVEEPDTLEPARQELRISLSTKQRCGVGGSAKDGEILIQGDQRAKLRSLLPALGYTRTKG